MRGVFGYLLCGFAYLLFQDNYYALFIVGGVFLKIPFNIIPFIYPILNDGDMRISTIELPSKGYKKK